MVAARPRAIVVLAVSALGYFVVLLDVTIVNVALPSIAGALRTSRAALQWIVDAYALALACLMLSGGHVADGFGRRRVFVAGLAIFGVASAACALAPTPAALIAARVAQGAGAAALLPASLALINAGCADAGQRAHAIGVWAAIGSLGLVAGPLLGGVLTSAFGWRAVFWLSVPLCAAAAVGALRCVAADDVPVCSGSRLDPLGQAAGALLLATVVAALIEGPRVGWASPAIIAAIALAVAAFAALIAVERRVARPMLDLAAFRNRGFSAANAAAGLMNLGVLGALFVLSLLFQAERGLSPVATGVRLLAVAAPLAVVPAFAGRLIRRAGPRLPAALGLTGTGAGFGLLALLGPSAAYLAMLGPLLLAGVALGFATPAIVTAATSSVGPDRAGMAAAVNNTARQAGGAIGVATIGGLAGSTAFACSAAALLAGGLLCALSGRRRPLSHADDAQGSPVCSSRASSTGSVTGA